MSDKTNYGQSLTHMIKGNLGAGILSMPRSFANLGLVSGLLVLPTLCVISAYCVHILVKSSRAIGKQLNDHELSYSLLARRSFELGPRWLSGFSHAIGRAVDTALLVTQIGVCCVYIVFVVDNVTSILASYHLHLAHSVTFLAIFPVTLALSFIRTLSRLAVASLLANLLQAIGLMLIVEYLSRDMLHDAATVRHDNFRPLSESALGFGSVMFAFEGISVVLPIYNRISNRKQFGSLCGVVNVSFFVILALYVIVGLLGYLRYGAHVKDSITLNLPAEPLYDAVRAMFTLSILLTYPLQFYVPNEIIWEWSKKNILSLPRLELELEPDASSSSSSSSGGGGGNTGGETKRIQVKVDRLAIIQKLEIVSPAKAALDEKQNVNGKLGVPGNVAATFEGLKSIKIGAEKYTLKPDASPDSVRHHHTGAANIGDQISRGGGGGGNSRFGSKVDLINNDDSASCNKYSRSSVSSDCSSSDNIPARYEYLCRVLVVVLTFTLAYSVPRLNLLMDLIGSFSGVLLCLVIPSLIHMAAYWEKLRGFKKCFMIVIDTTIVVLGLSAGVGGSLSSLNQIIKGH